jgi:hypothetical protein
MPAPDNNPQTHAWADRIAGSLRRQKKQNLLLVVLAVVGAIVVGRLALARLGTVPARAAAQAAPEAAPANSSPAAAFDARREKYLVNLDRRIERDIFRSNLPSRGDGATTRPEVRRQDGANPAEGEEDQFRAESNVRAQAQSLSLQSTMLGSAPTAMINGQVMRKGDWINGFRLTRIDSQSVVVTREGAEVSLRLKSLQE